jgi:large subunit ribosomal protein L32
MAVPKKRTSKRARDIRRSHDFLVANAATESCPSCGATKERHRVCASCGTYRGKTVFSRVDNDVVSDASATPAE